MKLSIKEKEQIEAGLATLKRNLLHHIEQLQSAQEGEVKVGHKVPDDKFLAKIDKYLSNSEGILDLLIDSGVMQDKICACTALCKQSTK